MHYRLIKSLGSLSAFLEWCDLPVHPNKTEVRKMFDKDPKIWSKRPLPGKMLDYAAYDVIHLFSANIIWEVKLKEEYKGIM